jgi:hypothetical protein
MYSTCACFTPAATSISTLPARCRKLLLASNSFEQPNAVSSYWLLAASMIDQSSSFYEP